MIVLIFLLSSASVKAQIIYYSNAGKLQAVTGNLHKWKPDSTDPKLLIKTRDQKGIIKKQDLPTVPITRYRKKPVLEDTSWQKKLRRPQKSDQEFEKNQINDEVTAEIVSPQNDKQQTVISGMGYSQINPADPSIAVGPSHIIQMINGNNGSALFKIMDKKGETLLGPAYLDQLPGSSHNGSGDGITWYDQFSQRYVMTEFGDTSATGTDINSLIIAVSASPDPLGSWYIYEFYTNGFFPDYPKYGNYPDVWFAATRDFTNEYEGSGLWAFDKKAMLTGKSEVSILTARVTDPDNKYNSLTPVTVGGNIFNGDSDKGYFLYFSDNELTAASNDQDSLGIISFKANFLNPSESKLFVEKGFEVPPFSSQVCETRNCAPSPEFKGYDVVSTKLMHKPNLRDFGSYQSIVLNHTVDLNGSGLSGIRWYELRKENEWEIKQQGTYGPQLADACSPLQYKHRFLGSILQNKYGQIALAYNFSSKTDYASLAFTGRQSTDPPNIFTHEETIIRAGTGYGTILYRWGDYNDISQDPENDSIFWFTGMTGVGDTWTTSIASFTISPKPTLDAKLSALFSPSACEVICNKNVSPLVLLRNNGITSLRALKLKISINDSLYSTYQWNGFLLTDEETNIQLPAFNLPEGIVKLKIWVEQTEGLSDFNPGNDTLTKIVEILPVKQVPFYEGWESEFSILKDWKIKTNGSSYYIWRKDENVGFEGSNSFYVDNYFSNERGKSSQLESPLIAATKTDSLALTFQIAAALYDEQSLDTLEILIATDCGKTITSVYKKWGAELFTRSGFLKTNFSPMQSEWRKETIPLTAFINKEFSIIFKATNQGGNNIFIDDIRVESQQFPELDLYAENIAQPFDGLCSFVIKPKVLLTSKGKKQANQAEVELWDGSQLIESKTWTGNLSRLESDTVVFSMRENRPNTQLRAVIKEVNRQKDDVSKNDTAEVFQKQIKSFALTFTENFEDGKHFGRWTYEGDSLNQWKIKNTGYGGGDFSIYSPHSDFKNSRSSIISPRLFWKESDLILLEFYTAAGYKTAQHADTLEVSVSVDCGLSWKSAYVIAGIELATQITSGTFEPSTDADWKLKHVDLTNLAKNKQEMLIRLTTKSGGNSNIFIDQIKVFTEKLPAKLKEKGYQFLPNPVKEKLNIQFYPNSVGLKSIRVTDIAGRTQYLSKMETSLNVNNHTLDFSKLAAGIYVVTLTYADRIVSEKIIKHNP